MIRIIFALAVAGCASADVPVAPRGDLSAAVILTCGEAPKLAAAATTPGYAMGYEVVGGKFMVRMPQSDWNDVLTDEADLLGWQQCVALTIAIASSR